MNRLPRIIGKAPSELTHEELLERLQSERTRVRRAIELWRSGVGLKARPKPRPKTKRQQLNRGLEELMKKYNLTQEEVLKIMEETQ